MKLTEKVRLYPSKEQREIIISHMDMFLEEINKLIVMDSKGVNIYKFTSKNIDADLPGCVRSECCKEAKKIVKKYHKDCGKATRKHEYKVKYYQERVAEGKKTRPPKDLKLPKLPELRSRCYYVTNQNYRVVDGKVFCPFRINGKTKRLEIPTKMTKRQEDIIYNSKLGTMIIYLLGDDIYAGIVYNKDDVKFREFGNVMGVDLGIQCPAVSYCTDGDIKFYGNGRKNRYIRLHYQSLRKSMAKGGHIDAIKRLGDKERRIMKDIDHKISREIINRALEHDVCKIVLEDFSKIDSNINRYNRRVNRVLHNWSFSRLSRYIEYKANMEGITVEYVDPSDTSKICPRCGKKNDIRGRLYECECGFRMHRDIVGAMNICRKSEPIG